MAIDGLTTIKSSLGPKDTMDRLEAQVKATGMSVFARIDHAAGASSVGLDLPLRALVWQDASGNSWLSYNDPVWLARRHGVTGETEAVAGKLSAALAAVALAATTSG